MALSKGKLARKGPAVSVLIQYEGFEVEGNFRVYRFQVVDAPGEFRHFTIGIPSVSFRPALLKFQDGPPISFERLKQAIDGETEASRTKAHMKIGEPEIQEYMQRHSPRKK